MKVNSIHTVLLILAYGAMVSCGTAVENRSGGSGMAGPVNTSDEWLIPNEEVLDGGPGKDGIPSIDAPRFARAEQVDYVDEDRLVVGIKINETVKAYPHEVLDYHEIVNDRIDDEQYSLTYCPLTGTAICWYRSSVNEFGVSGLLFRNNLIPYDRSTGSRYSQMQMRAVNGPLAGVALETIPVVQTAWTAWKAMYPKSSVLTTNTGFSFNYDRDLYGRRYREENSGTLFPVKNSDTRLPKKELVHGVIWGSSADDEAKVRTYVIDEFGTGVHLVTDHFAGGQITVAGSSDGRFAVSFFNTLEDGTGLQFEAVRDSLPVIMKDQEENYWDLFGFATEGPRTGTRLIPTNSYTGYWFAWADFFPNVEIYRSE